MVDEKAELDRKLTAMNVFIETNPTFYAACITDNERARMRRQRIHMTEYSKVLGERISAFDGETDEPVEGVVGETSACCGSCK